ncbi:uncharacterized protein LOC62_01G000195 [Vanrija pseudolonga]|uniref:Uncharacterized protein n=1 Tax=Vanrija pseudolonga TaxID=143232 RepID=A0AAF0Y4J0_9TREE|nr:hypothetical protein LOC62_01G000195 [Vanrija pseudolonga]
MSASSGTTLISPSNALPAAAAATAADQAQSLGQAAAAAPSGSEASAPTLQRRGTRSSAHSVHSAGHGHGHGHGHHERHHSSHHHTAHHGAHPRRLSSHSSHGRRRGSEGEGGRRALAAGLTMHVLDAAAAAKDGKKAPVTKRKTSDASKSSSSNAAAHAAAVKSSRSDTHLPRLSRTASQVSVVSSGGSGSGPGKKRKDVPLHVDRRKGSVEVIAGDGAGAQQPDDEEWESGGEEASAPSAGITPAAAVLAAAHPQAAQGQQQQQQVVQEPRALPLRRAASDRPLQNSIAFTESPIEALSPRTTLRATGFPSASSDRSLVDDQVTFATTRGGGAAAPQPQQHPAAAPPAPAPDSQPGSARPASTSTAADTPEEPVPGFPFPTMAENTGSPADAAPPAPEQPRQRVVSQPPAPLRRLASHSSLRSATSLRAPHPLNSPTGGRNGFAGVFGTTPSRQHRVASLHYPPAAPAVVYREHVEGQMEDYVPETPASMVLDLPELNDPPARPRVGSFSSMRSLKDILGQVVGSPAPPASPSAQSTYSVGRPASRRVATTGSNPRRPTAMSVAAKVSRLKTTSNPVEYHQSLGFSSATAETAHLLSRFLPPKKPRRPRWAMTVREAHAAHQAAADGEEPRVGLTDGQYRAAHESLVTTLQELGGTKRTSARRPSTGAGSLPRGYSYHSLLSAVDELAIGSHPAPESTAPTAGPAGLIPAKAGLGRSPFELSAARVLAQRNKAGAY